MLGPYEEFYDELAQLTGLERANLVNVAHAYAAAAAPTIPEDATVQHALRYADFDHFYPLSDLWTCRAAFGRILGDLYDAGLLDATDPGITESFECFDVALALTRAERRPSTIPSPPPGGHDQTAGHWNGGIDARLRDYLAAADHDGSMIAAHSTLRVLNWDNVEEEVSAGTTVSPNPPGRPLTAPTVALLRNLYQPVIPRRPVAGEPLVTRNVSYRLMQTQEDWLAFRPDIAAFLGWRPNPQHPGRWHTSTGQLAVYTIRWIDGWWTHTGKAFDDTCARGNAVILTPTGSAALTDSLGSLTRTITITRGAAGQERIEDSVTRSYTSTIPMT